MSHAASPVTSVLFALGANGAIAGAKLFAAIQTGSHSMLAESIHSFADCGNQVLLLFGMKWAKRLPTPDHPLGYGKDVYFWSFVVAIMLFSMGGLFSIYEGVHKLDSAEPLRSPLLAVGILVFSIVMESVSLWGCLREINKQRRGRPLWRWFRETRESALIVVLGEDLAALAGLVLALAAILLTIHTGNPIYDAMGSIAIGVLLVAVAVAVGWEIHELLIGQSVEPETRQAIRTHLEERPEIARLFSLITLQLGEDVMVAVKAEMTEKTDAAALIAAINTCEASLRERFHEVRWIFFEPDHTD